MISSQIEACTQCHGHLNRNGGEISEKGYPEQLGFDVSFDELVDENTRRKASMANVTCKRAQRY